MPECPIARLSNWRFGSRRDETRRDDARHSATRGMSLAEEEARRQNEVYDALIRELERVPDDARGAVASFLQDLRRDGVEWHSIGHGEADDERTVFPEYAAPCTRATRIPGSVCMKFAHEHGAPWDQWTCAYAAGFGNLQSLQYAHEHGCPWDVWTCRDAALNGHLDCLRYAREHGCCWDKRTCEGAAKYGQLECLKYACARKCPGSDRYAEALNEVVIPDVDESFGVDVALEFQRANDGEISMREFLPLWVAHREGYRDAHLEVVRNLIAHD